MLRASAERIISDHENGSSKIARRFLQDIIDITSAASFRFDGQTRREFLDLLQRLPHIRPSMAVFAAIAAEFGPVLTEKRSVAAKAQLQNTAQTLLQLFANAPEKIAGFLEPLLAERSVALTYSFSSVVLQTLQRIHTKIDGLYILESAPGREGIALATTIRENTELDHWNVTLAPDMLLDMAMSMAQCCVIGADALLGDGNFVNKCGARLLLRSAAEQRKPVYIVCESLKIAPTGWLWRPEIFAPSECIPQAPRAVTVLNEPFEMAPLQQCVVVTETGVFSVEQIAARAQERARVLP